MSLIDVIKYEGKNDTFVWKHPEEDFNTKSQLIVHQSQEAILFLNGQMCDSFGPGKHTLETQNIPILNKIINLPTGGVSQFHCEVYFVNLVELMSIRWGTDSKIQYMDPEFNFPLSIGANGELSLSVDNPRTLLRKIVGTEVVLSKNDLVVYLRAILMQTVKTYIAQKIKSNKINIFELDENLSLFSKDIQEMLVDDFLEYGIKLNLFKITGFAKPEGDPIYERYKDLFFRKYADIAEAKLKKDVSVIEQEAEKEKTIIEAEALSQKRKIEGYTYHQERGYDIAEKVASNEGVGQFSSMGVGLGVMAGVGNQIGQTITDSLNQVNNQNVDQTKKRFCENCGNPLEEGSKFCDNCGFKLVDDSRCVCGYEFTRPSKFCPECGRKRG